MWHLSIRSLRQYLDRKLDKKRMFNELQDSQWDNLKQGAQRIVRWVKDSAAGQREINTEHAHEIWELRKRCAHLGHCVDTGVEDRDAADNALEERIEALESLLGIEKDEQESSSSTRDSASEQRLDCVTLREEEHNRMKRQLEVQAHEPKALKARVNTQRSGQSTQSYEVDEEFGRPESSNKKRKVSSAASSDRHDETDVPVDPTTVTSPGLRTHEYQLYIEPEHNLVRVGCGPLIDTWVKQCNDWTRVDPNWQRYKPFETCLNSMLSTGYGNMVESPEEVSSFACSDCERSRTFCVVFDSQRGLLKLLPRVNASRAADRQIIDLTTFINPTQRPTNRGYQELY
ncbi:hypothetical protein KCU77_g504, partial [Aureobasidium melanogenum]